MTTEIAKVSQVSQINCGTFGSSQFTDLLMTNLIYSKLGDCFKDSFTLNLANISKLVLLMSINEIRGSFGDIIKWVLAKCKDSPLLVYSLARQLVMLRYRFQKRVIVTPSTVETVPLPHHTDLNVDTNFLVALSNYLSKNPGCSYRKTIRDIELKNAKEQLFTDCLHDIVIPLGSKKFLIRTPIKIKTNMVNGEAVAAGIDTCSSIASARTSVTSYLDILPPDQRDVIQKLREGYISGGNTLTALTTLKCGHSYSSSSYFSEETAVEMLLTRYPNLDPTDTLISVILLTCFYNSPSITAMCQDDRLWCDPWQKYPGLSKQLSKTLCFYATLRWASVQANAKNNGCWNGKWFDEHVSTSSIKEAKSTNSLSIVIESSKDIHATDDIREFVTEVYKCSKQHNDKVKIFYLTLSTEIKTSEVPNPEYAQWEQKRDLLDKMKADPKVFAELVIPPKTIPKETTEKKITVKQLNEIEKDIDTLYLRKADKEILVSCLSQFRDKKEVIRSLGLPNKLNILLYGVPGTGKSTTIQAVATYLRKDIYYVDLKDAATNADLQMIFEYVNKNVANGGIVVIEDIDAMTEVVLKRTPLEPSSPSGRSSLPCDHKSKLTLDYFLNILQGTLTLDDSIFIVTTNHLTHLDPAFYRDGRFDVKVELKLCDTFQMNSIYRRILNRDIPMDLLKQLPEDKFSPAALIFHVKNYMFTPNTPDEEILKPFLAMN
jgi:hypothetical protein